MAVLRRLAGGHSVREASLADRAELAAIESEAFAEPWSEAALGRALADPLAVVVAVEGPAKELAAYALLQAVAGEAELMRVATRPELRSRGFGLALVECICEAAAERGVGECFLEVRHDNAPALAIYERAGFERCGLRRDYYGPGVDGVLMVRRLARG